MRSRVVVELLVAVVGVGCLWWAWRADGHWFEIHTSWCYCAETQARLAGGRVLRIVGAVLGFVLLLVIRPSAGQWAARTPPRELLVRSARVGLAVVLALVVGEVWLRLRAPPPLRYEPESELDDRWLYRPMPLQVADVRVGDRWVRFVTDANGWRVRKPDDTIDFSRPTIVSTGESVASGFGLKYDETYAAMLAETTGLQVVNVAVQAYANDAAYARLADALPRFQHPVAALTLLLPATLDRNLWPDRGHFFERDGSLTFEPSEPAWMPHLEVAKLFERSVFHTDEALLRARAALAASSRAARARGAAPLVILLMWPDCVRDDTGVPWLEHILFDGIDAPHVRIEIPPDGWDAPSMHPGPRTHRIIADRVAAALADVISSSAAATPTP